MVDQPHGHDGHNDVHQADARRGQDGSRSCGDSRRLHDERRIINDRVDPGDLLKDGQADADHQRHSNRRIKQIGEVTTLLRLGQRLLNLQPFRFYVFCASNSRQYPARKMGLAAFGKPSRALGHAEHA